MVVTEAIKIEKETKKKLDKLKSHKRDTYDDVIDNIASMAIVQKIDEGKNNG